MILKESIYADFKQKLVNVLLKKQLFPTLLFK